MEIQILRLYNSSLSPCKWLSERLHWYIVILFRGQHTDKSYHNNEW